MNYFILAIFCFIILYILFYSSDHTLIDNKVLESFDEKITRSTKTNCGIACTKVFGCKGFQSDEANNICYLSKSTIMGSPTNSVFGDEYSKNTERCNKITAAVDTYEISESEKKANATYSKSSFLKI